ncbi:MAG TPA: Yip1 family protein [Allosphingosinicella sp.]|jgi:hypothetical protein|nr:Yip1 family protein [Allosphingosinicella sp.]
MTDGPTTPTPPPGGMPGAPVSIVDRVKNILITPRTEWAVIAAERSSIQQIYTTYVLILAAIPPIAGIIGAMLFVPRIGGVSYGAPIGYLIAMAVFGYVVSLVIVFLMALIIEALAPSFGGTKDRLQAFKISAYASTPVWVIGILSLFPPLALLVWLAYIYVAFLIYQGLGPVLRVPEDKSIVFTIVIVVCYVGLIILISAIVGALMLSMFMASVSPVMIR